MMLSCFLVYLWWYQYHDSYAHLVFAVNPCADNSSAVPLCWSLNWFFSTAASHLTCGSMEYCFHNTLLWNASNMLLNWGGFLCSEWCINPVGDFTAKWLWCWSSKPSWISLHFYMFWSSGEKKCTTLSVLFLLPTATLVRVIACGFLTFVVPCLAPERCKTSEIYMLSNVNVHVDDLC